MPQEVAAFRAVFWVKPNRRRPRVVRFALDRLVISVGEFPVRFWGRRSSQLKPSSCFCAPQLIGSSMVLISRCAVRLRQWQQAADVTVTHAFDAGELVDAAGPPG